MPATICSAMAGPPPEAYSMSILSPDLQGNPLLTTLQI